MMFDPANLSYWLFLGMGVALFGLAIAGGDQETESDLDTDVDSDFDADGLNIDEFDALRSLGIGKAPLLLLLAIDLSILGLTGWILNVLWGNIFGYLPTGVFSILVFLIALSCGVGCGSLLSHPLGKIFANFGEDSSKGRLIGCTGIVASGAIFSDRLGQVDVRDANHNLVTIMAQIPEWATVSPQLGEKVLVIDLVTDPVSDRSLYLVIAEETADYDHWMRQQDSPR